MSQDLSEPALARLLDAFLDHSLPADQWSHHAHLVCALMLARRMPEAELLPFLRHAISSYNVASGGRNTATAGYHEAITAFYAAVIAAFARATANKPLSDAARLLITGPISDRLAPALAYPAQTLDTVLARLDGAPFRPDFDPEHLALEAAAHG